MLLGIFFLILGFLINSPLLCAVGVILIIAALLLRKKKKEKKMQAKKKYILIQSQDEEDLWEFRKPQSIEIKETELKELGELEKLILFPL